LGDGRVGLILDLGGLFRLEQDQGTASDLYHYEL